MEKKNTDLNWNIEETDNVKNKETKNIYISKNDGRA